MTEDTETTADAGISATWRLLWTTEVRGLPVGSSGVKERSLLSPGTYLQRETLWILQNAPLFGTKAGEVYQVIDAAGGSLQNVIEFPPKGAFIVDSKIEVEGPQRCGFQQAGCPNGREVEIAALDGGSVGLCVLMLPSSPCRVGFRFTAATLKLPSRSVPLPPFGKGWFDTIYVDDRIRIAEDSRGDVLVVARDGAPRVFR